MKVTRRDFLKGAAATAAAFGVPTIVPATVFGAKAPSNRLLIGQIGCGRIARDHDLPETMADERALVVALCDVDSKRLREGKTFVEEWYAKENRPIPPIKLYGNYRDLLADPQIDAVVISTPDHWHAQPAIEAALAGKDIYLQKPSALTVRESRQLSDVIHRTGRVFQMGSQQRSMPQFRIACELVRNGRVGNLKRIVIGLPVDPSGEEEPEMPIPPNLNYEMWLGSTPYVYYTEKRVHPQNDYSRPGWLRCEQFGAGMITGWGSHHLDIANWAMGAEYTNFVEVEAEAQFPTKGLWDVHGPFTVHAKFADGVEMIVSDSFPNGVRFEGDEGWIFVTRGNYAVTASDPVSKKNSEALSASDPKLLSPLPKDAVRLHVSNQHHIDWINAVFTRTQPVAPVEPAHRACTNCLLSHIAMKLKRKLYWDPKKERFINDDQANAMLERPQRWPYGTNYVL
ncbi:MAG: Gfo/Idh/MocA family oxidoreductase [candidate division KSB1 bacterium]|nr:Gfo/Idh/MocA family oxidoreductase [candidate division KSB1 bacterium]